MDRLTLQTVQAKHVNKGENTGNNKRHEYKVLLLRNFFFWENIQWQRTGKRGGNIKWESFLLSEEWFDNPVEKKDNWEGQKIWGEGRGL